MYRSTEAPVVSHCDGFKIQQRNKAVMFSFSSYLTKNRLIMEGNNMFPGKENCHLKTFVLRTQHQAVWQFYWDTLKKSVRANALH